MKRKCMLVAICMGWAASICQALPPGYDVYDLGLGDPTAINEAGQIAGSKLYGSNWYDRRATLWDGQTVTKLEAFGRRSVAYGINDVGQVVGMAILGGSTERSVLWEDGSFEDLNIGSSDADSYALAINDSGRILGTRRHWQGWLLDGNQYAEPPAFIRKGGINDAGHAVGMTEVGYDAGRRAVFVDNGVVTTLPILGGESGAYAINEDDWVVGYSSSGGIRHAAVWKPTVLPDGTRHWQVTDLGVLSGWTEASDINNMGLISGIGQAADGTWHALVWEQGTMYELEKLVDLPAGYKMENAVGINDIGQIACRIISPSGTRVVLLDPIPEPASLGLLGLGGLALLRRRGRRRK